MMTKRDLRTIWRKLDVFNPLSSNLFHLWFNMCIFDVYLLQSFCINSSYFRFSITTRNQLAVWTPCKRCYIAIKSFWDSEHLIHIPNSYSSVTSWRSKNLFLRVRSTSPNFWVVPFRQSRVLIMTTNKYLMTLGVDLYNLSTVSST